jgi:site-specific DNA-methyltransferase (adenine-specific)
MLDSGRDFGWAGTLVMVDRRPDDDAHDRLSTPCYQDGLVTIYTGDSTRLSFLEDESIDLVITSPPYNLDVSYNGYHDDVPYDDYIRWVGTWARALYRVATSGGRACINIPLDSNKGGKRPVYADFVRAFIEAGWSYQTTIVWNENNISRRTAWGSWLSPSAPFVTAPVEMIPVFHKGPWPRRRTDRTTDITRDEFLDWTLGVWEADSEDNRDDKENREDWGEGGYWKFPGENSKTVKHPAPFPLELPTRLIKLYSYVEDLVLDPFLGSGTTCCAAKALGRRSIGVDVDAAYCRTAAERVARVRVPD